MVSCAGSNIDCGMSSQTKRVREAMMGVVQMITLSGVEVVCGNNLVMLALVDNEVS